MSTLIETFLLWLFSSIKPIIPDALTLFVIAWAIMMAARSTFDPFKIFTFGFLRKPLIAALVLLPAWALLKGCQQDSEAQSATAPAETHSVYRLDK